MKHAKTVSLKNRRMILKAGLGASLLSCFGLTQGRAESLSFSAASSKLFNLPDSIRRELYDLYGSKAEEIRATDKLELKAPDIAENGAVVPFSISSKTETIFSIAAFAEKNPVPRIAVVSLHAGANAPIHLRAKIPGTTDLYAIVKTSTGLYGLKKEVKVSLGCMGGGG